MPPHAFDSSILHASSFPQDAAALLTRGACAVPVLLEWLAAVLLLPQSALQLIAQIVSVSPPSYNAAQVNAAGCRQPGHCEFGVAPSGACVRACRLCWLHRPALLLLPQLSSPLISHHPHPHSPPSFPAVTRSHICTHLGAVLHRHRDSR